MKSFGNVKMAFRTHYPHNDNGIDQNVDSLQLCDLGELGRLIAVLDGDLLLCLYPQCGFIFCSKLYFSFLF